VITTPSPFARTGSAARGLGTACASCAWHDAAVAASSPSPLSARTPHAPEWLGQCQILGSAQSIQRAVKERLRAGPQRQISYGRSARPPVAPTADSPRAPAADGQCASPTAECASAATSTTADAPLERPEPPEPPVPPPHAPLHTSHTPSLAAQLFRTQALLSQSMVEQRRLHAELHAAHEAAAAAQATAAASIEQERERYRREADFLRKGVQAAAAQREATFERRQQSHERALRRAVRETEERVVERMAAATTVAASDREAVHASALSTQAERHEAELSRVSGLLISLAHEVGELERQGVWPAGGPEPQGMPMPATMDAYAAYDVLRSALARLKRNTHKV
jgi:hypothetical protein